MLKKAIFVVLICELVTASFLNNVFAYNAETTHAALAQEIVDFYNNGGSSITPQQKEWLIQGSIDEDVAPRWVNHFYDPVNQAGWTGEKTGNLSTGLVQFFSNVALAPVPPISAVQWANDSITQGEYARYGGDRSWKRGLDYYAYGDEKEAYITLGHILHLLEDLSVPDHARNDTHSQISGVTGGDASPYEEYATKWTRSTIKSLDISGNLHAENAAAPARTSVEDYLTAMAEYSNKYFFSKDTITDAKYPLPKIDENNCDGSFCYGIDENEQKFPLVKMYRYTDNNNQVTASYFIKNVEEQYPILSAYFSHLSRQVVLNGAGLIKLFKKQAEDAVVNKEFTMQRPDLVLKNQINSVFYFSLAGEWYKITNGTKSFFSRMFAMAQDTASFIGGLFSGGEAGQTVDVYNSGTIAPQDSGAPTAQNAAQSQTQIPAPQNSPVQSANDVQPAVQSPSNGIQNNDGMVLVASNIAYGGGGGNSPGGGGVSAVPQAQSDAANGNENNNSATTTSASTETAQSTSTATSTENFTSTGNSTSTETATSAENSTSTATSTAAAANATSSQETATSTTQEATTTAPYVIFSQLVQSAESSPSHYSDNWYKLGGGFSGTLNSLTLKGMTSDANSGRSFLQITEFKDSAYRNKIREIIITDNAPFTHEATTTKLGNLSVALKPYFYYRLDTLGGFQNVSVILAGANSTGTAMSNIFESGVGRVESIYTFTPFMIMEGESLASAAPAPIAAPGNLTAGPFDSFNMKLDVSWLASTDPEWPANPLRYELNYSTSTELAAGGWQSAGAALQTTIPVELRQNYIFGARAADDFGGVSAAATTSWNFPANFVELPSQLNHDSGLRYGMQKIALAASATISGFAMWIGPGEGQYCCSASLLNVYRDAGGQRGDLVAQSGDITLNQWDSRAEHVYSFSSPLALAAGSYWFTLGVPSGITRTNDTSVFGSGGDAYVGGFWADMQGNNLDGDAYFRFRVAPQPQL